MMQWFDTTLKDKVDEADGVKTFVFEKPGDYAYKAGQFSFIRVGKHQKHFTMSSSPTRDFLEYTTIISGSDFKQALDNLHIGSEAQVSEAKGSFTLEKLRSDRICYLAGGIGVTPARSFIEYLSDSGGEIKSFTLLYSNRTSSRISYRGELEELEEKLDYLKVVYTLTDEEWAGETGFINQEMIAKYIDEVEENTFFISGPPRFNEAMVKVVQGLGVGEDMVVTENFSGY